MKRLIKTALNEAFVMNPCTVYELFTTQTLMVGETVDVFFAAPKKLAVRFEGLSEQTFVHSFMAALPVLVKQLLRVSTSIEAMLIEQLLEHAQAIIRDEAELGELVVMATQMIQSGHTNPLRLDP